MQLGFHSAGIFAAALPDYQLGAIPPYLVPESLPLEESTSGFENEEWFSTTEAELTTESTSLLQYNASPFSADEWINNFEHNATHVKMPTNNDTLELLWQDELVKSVVDYIIEEFTQLETITNDGFNNDVA